MCADHPSRLATTTNVEVYRTGAVNIQIELVLSPCHHLQSFITKSLPLYGVYLYNLNDHTAYSNQKLNAVLPLRKADMTCLCLIAKQKHQTIGVYPAIMEPTQVPIR